MRDSISDNEIGSYVGQTGSLAYTNTHNTTLPTGGNSALKALAMQVRGQEFASPECMVGVRAHLESQLCKGETRDSAELADSQDTMLMNSGLK